MKGYAAMDKNDFERFVLDNGKDILRFCIMTAGDKESGCELYQNTMLKLMEKLTKVMRFYTKKIRNELAPDPW